MKTIKYLGYIILVFWFVSCNENEWLEEVPLDFYSPENSFSTAEHFESAITNLYSDHRSQIFFSSTTLVSPLMSIWGDNLYSFYAQTNAPHEQLTPEIWFPIHYWTAYYKMIFNANVILDRIDNEDIDFKNESDRTVLKAEALFFRALSYKDLTILFGDVPLVLEEIASPKRDFSRTPKTDVLHQVEEDLMFAAENLPHVSELEEDGRLTKAAANHLLAEVYLITKDWVKSIDAASKVINDGSYALMTERFGTRKNEAGDVFWDLFRRDNQNRHGNAGINTESIWVSQYEYNVPGSGSNWVQTRMFSPFYWSLVGKIDNEPLFFGHSSQNGGRSQGWFANNDHMNYTVWEADTTDIRNSEYNIMRDMVADNPESIWFGKKIVENDAILTPGPYNEFWRPYWTKYVPINNFPEETISNNPYPGATHNSANGSFTDNYIMRLSETYLLRAEAYLGKGDLPSAAADINVVRERAKASPVSPAEVDLDYILDERIRELSYEEKRLLTLMRTDLYLERVKKYNPHYNGKYYSFDLNEKYKLWPIPQSEIERNTEALLEQNPGY